MVRLRAVLVLAAACALSAGLVAPLFAQVNQPVYPVYDGFTKRADGTFVLSFAYFSHNAEAVTIATGPNNSFAPDPADRQQATTFFPGHHRFQCIMLVGPEFDGTLRWTLSHAGTSTSTTENMLQYSWEFDEGSLRQAMRGVDPDTVPRGVCLNRPPVARVLGLVEQPALVEAAEAAKVAGGAEGERPPTRGLAVTLPDELRLFGSVEDEGLPRDGSLTATWTKVSGPGSVTFKDPSAARTLATFSQPGMYELELTASDSVHTGNTRVSVVVSAPR